jgi:hypothetical protein
MEGTTSAFRVAVGFLALLVCGGYVGILAMNVPSRERKLVSHCTCRRKFGLNREGIIIIIIYIIKGL